MTIEPIIKVKMEKFQKDYILENISEDQLFERFVNYNILSLHQPYILSTDNELLDDICVGDSNDMGIDGIAISLNGRFIKSELDINDILAEGQKGKFEFVFLQSKNKNKFDLGEYSKFVFGVEDFLNENITQPYNENIKKWHKLKNYIFSDDIMIKWEKTPDVRLYYVVMGNWENSQHILARSELLKSHLESSKFYDKIFFHYVDSKAFNDILNNNENNYTTVINFIDSMSLNEVNNVDNSCVILCRAMDLVDLLKTNENLIRKNLFEDNVRDFQGTTVINDEIKSTLKNNCESFMLLNNGITIVCDEIRLGNRKITIRNPQIVNGCQTCNVLFHSYLEGINIADASVIIKFISTKSPEITNMVVRGANRQNIVYDEAFEVTREFHKLLEEFFISINCKPYGHIYYERRSKQYNDNPLVKPYQRVTFKIMIQSIVSLFLYKVHEGHRHESKLLESYRNEIFVTNQSFYPYYTAALLYMKTEHMFRCSKLDRKVYPYKMQIILLIKELTLGKSPNINRKKEIEKYCKSMLEFVNDDAKLYEQAILSINYFNNIVNQWTTEKGQSYYYAIKDSADFTKFMLSSISSYNDILIQTKEVCEDKLFRGRVLQINRDKHGKYYGFISRRPDNIFFHQEDNGQIIDWEKLKNNDVTYHTKIGIRDTRAIDVKLTDELI